MKYLERKREERARRKKQKSFDQQRLIDTSKMGGKKTRKT